MDIVVIGEGGHGKVVKELIHSRGKDRIIGLLDDRYNNLQLVDGVYTGPISSAHFLIDRVKELKFVIAIGNNAIRKSIVNKLGFPRESYISLIHETAIISKSATIGHGTVVMAHTIINADAVIGDHAIINSGAIVEHDARMGNYVHAAPKSLLTGAVRAEEGAMIGAGATIIPGKNIGDWAVIGAGATVISDIPPHMTAVGTPARLLMKIREGCETT
ncbi:acetyltransferase [Paenibacillus sp. HWE-109]|uniref:acetyltransferase n=1 Tax=Paenibacillus sp. HWE-109 TaxID=1306526 RepID=UPI001EE04BB2|nr:acetyltransferase [Paenibacillus sp. HWE-109]UKS24905.1 acetyltransferase [Paenibacillus sp. HWE-109]